jgi:hypothetical protein
MIESAGRFSRSAFLQVQGDFPNRIGNFLDVVHDGHVNRAF